jgi:uncharacterized protein YacL
LPYAKRSDFVVARIVVVVILAAIAAVSRPFDLTAALATLVGLGVGIAVVVLEGRLRQAGLKQLIVGTAGMVIGSVSGLLLVALLSHNSLLNQSATLFLQLVVPVSFSYMGLVVGISKAELVNLNQIGIFSNEAPSQRSVKLLDTSVIIDGRIADVAESGFLEGQLVVPQFVLRELQLVADSSDSTKRNRGRRGLDVLQRLQKMAQVDVRLVDEDVPNAKEVDLKLIELAKIYRGRIVTNDFNLNKVAQVHGVAVMNINELANALKPIVLPGESMRVFILKEGKEHNQGVAYLDDGTMVVVDNARRHISRTIDITVTSVLQTTAGKMIFGKFDERGDKGSQGAGERPSATVVNAQHAVAGAASGSGKQARFG